MSSGAFERSKYESDDDEIHPIRIQPETAEATFGGTANAAPAGAITNSISARVSNGNRQFGLKPRTVTLVFNSSPPANYKAGTYIRIPILTQSLYEAIELDTVVSYLGGTPTVVGKSAERVR